jgi:hypothetical protein
MTSNSIVSTIQRIIRQELRRVRIAELGVVEAVDPHGRAAGTENYGCDVRLKNSGLLLPWGRRPRRLPRSAHWRRSPLQRLSQVSPWSAAAR